MYVHFTLKFMYCLKYLEEPISLLIALRIFVLKNIVYNDSTSSKSKKERKLKKRKKQKKIDLYVVRLNENGELLDSKPCNECLNAMKYTGINKVYYSTSNQEIIMEKVKHMKPSYVSYHQDIGLCTNIKVWRF